MKSTDLAPSPEETFSLSRMVSEDGRIEEVLRRVAADYAPLRRPEVKFDRAKAANAFQEAFELIGGVPRLAIFAHYHEKDFYRMYSRMLPSATSQEVNHSGEVIIRPALPRSALDEAPETTEDGVIIDNSTGDVE